MSLVHLFLEYGAVC